MFSSSTFITLALATSSALAQMIIQTPASLIECQPALLSWSGGSAPYYLAAIPGGQPSAAALKDFGMQSGNSYTWNVDLAAGTSLTLKITDSTGATNYNQAVTIQAGSSTACFGAAVASSTAGTSTAMMASTTSAMMSSVMTSMSTASGSSMTSKSEMPSASANGAAAVSSGMSMSKSGSMSASMMSGSSTASISRAAQVSGSTTASAAFGSASTTSSAFATIHQVSFGALAIIFGAISLAMI